MNKTTTSNKASLSDLDNISMERGHIQEFLDRAREDEFRNLFLNNACGTGKSRLMANEIIKRVDDPFVIVVQDYHIAEKEHGWIQNFDEARTTSVIFKGKNQKDYYTGEDLCKREEGDRYWHGCAWEENGEKIICEHVNSCLYYVRKREAMKARVVITSFENLTEFQDRYIVFDEAIDGKMLNEKTIAESEYKQLVSQGLVHTPIKSVNMDFKHHKKNSHLKFECGTVTQAPDVPIVSERSYFMFNFFTNAFVENSENNASDALYITKFKMKDKTLYTLFGRRKNYLPERYRAFFYLCATSSIEVVRSVTETEHLAGTIMFDWLVCNQKYMIMKDVLNPLFKFRYNWTKSMSKNHLKEIIKIMDFYFGKRKILVVTKLEFEKKFLAMKNAIPSVVHYGRGRGTNEFEDEEYSAVLVYGRYGFNPNTVIKLKKIGFSDHQISSMEMSEMEQSIHRARPLLHPEIPIISLSDQFLFVDPEGKKSDWNPISMKVLEAAFDVYDYDVTGKTLREIDEKLKPKYQFSHRLLADFKRFMTYFSYSTTSLEESGWD